MLPEANFKIQADWSLELFLGYGRLAVAAKFEALPAI